MFAEYQKKPLHDIIVNIRLVDHVRTHKLLSEAIIVIYLDEGISLRSTSVQQHTETDEAQG